MMRLPVGQTVRWRMIGHKIIQEGGVVLADDVRLGIGSPWVDDAGLKRLWGPPVWDLHIDGEAVFTGEILVYTMAFSGGRYRLQWEGRKTTVLLSLVSEGQMSANQEGRPGVVLVPGQGSVVFPGDVADIEIAPGTRLVTVECPLTVLNGHNLGPKQTPMVISGDTLAESVRDFAAGVLRTNLKGPLNNFLTDQLLSEMLVGMVLTAAGIGHLQQSQKSDLYAAAMALISARFMNPDFALKPLASLLETSVRTLQTVFAARGELVSHAIRDRRIREAQRLLSSPEFAALSTQEIAELAGFGNSRRMLRSFHTASLAVPNRRRPR